MRKKSDGSEEKHTSRCRRYVKAPIRRMFHKARHLYVKNLVDFGNRAGFGGAIGCPAPVQVSRLPRSFSFNNFSTALVAPNSGGAAAATKQTEEEDWRRPPSVGSRGLWRCHSSMALGRIDEDTPCNFDI